MLFDLDNKSRQEYLNNNNILDLGADVFIVIIFDQVYHFTFVVVNKYVAPSWIALKKKGHIQTNIEKLKERKGS